MLEVNTGRITVKSKNVILEKTKVLFCYGKYLILIIINKPLSLSISCYN